MPNGNFEPGFPDLLVDEFNQIRDLSGASEEMTMAFMLEKYNARIALLKQDSNGNFKKLGTKETTNVNGLKTYIVNNCQ